MASKLLMVCLRTGSVTHGPAIGSPRQDKMGGFGGPDAHLKVMRSSVCTECSSNGSIAFCLMEFPDKAWRVRSQATLKHGRLVTYHFHYMLLQHNNGLDSTGASAAVKRVVRSLLCLLLQQRMSSTAEDDGGFSSFAAVYDGRIHMSTDEFLSLIPVLPPLRPPRQSPPGRRRQPAVASVPQLDHAAVERRHVLVPVPPQVPPPFDDRPLQAAATAAPRRRHSPVDVADAVNVLLFSLPQAAAIGAVLVQTVGRGGVVRHEPRLRGARLLHVTARRPRRGSDLSPHRRLVLGRADGQAGHGRGRRRGGGGGVGFGADSPDAPEAEGGGGGGGGEEDQAGPVRSGCRRGRGEGVEAEGEGVEWHLEQVHHGKKRKRSTR
ncbi:hypothetical protein MUK42_18891 [Musa troglodytarum]|uniref:Uncharacterized protein n=1 Tax=Musa troglodytarum TaxID=320322 RepID=A0A9E7FD45_9LILI|nr:hypothetical protein MUK42_18891 [Musa troglodytarum]